MAEGDRAVRSRQSTRVLVMVVGALALVILAAVLLVPRGQPTSTAAGPELRIAPAAVLLPSVGATQTLTASTVGADGVAKPAAATWTSSHPDVVAVDAAGIVTAKALGSAQVTAAADGHTSAPIVVVVAAVAPGVRLVADEQVVGDIVATDPDGEPSADATYQVTLKGITPAVGDRLAASGGAAIAGEVVAVAPAADGVTVTLRVVPLPELLPDLDLHETLSLGAGAPAIPKDVVDQYDISRTGDTYTFTPKASFEQAIQAASAAGDPRTVGLARHGASGPIADAGPVAAGPVGTRALFDCTTSSGAVSDSGVLPFKLSKAPSFTLDINPSLDLVWDRTDQHFIVRAAPKAKIEAGLKLTATLDVAYTCEAILTIFRIPVGGVLSAFVSGLVPVSAGFEIGGKVDLATFGMTTTVEPSATVAVGFTCPGGGSCQAVGDVDPAIKMPTVDVDAPSLADLRIKPSFEVFAKVTASIGNPILRKLRIDAVDARIGGKLAADWAPRAVQILDPSYASNYKLSLELKVAASPKLGDVAKKLGLTSISSIEVKKSTNLGGSPSGQLDVSKTTLTAGQQTSATVHLEKDVSLLGLYDVDKVVLVRYSGGTETELASVSATVGQTDFDLPFTAPQLLKTSELYAFVVPAIPPAGLLQLEVDRHLGAPTPIVFSAVESGKQPTIYSINPDGTGLVRLTDPSTVAAMGPSWSRDGSQLAFFQQPVGGSGIELFVANRDGSSPRKLATSVQSVYPAAPPAWTSDGRTLLFTAFPTVADAAQLLTIGSDGTGKRQLTSAGSAYRVEGQYSPDESTIVCDGSIQGGPTVLFIGPADGSSFHQLTTPDAGHTSSSSWHESAPHWSPDGTRIVWSRLENVPGVGTWGQIWSMSPDGAAAQALTTGTTNGLADLNPAWSPDGSHIAFIREQGAIWKLMVMDADGSNVHEVQTGLEIRQVFGLSWAPG